MTDEKLNEAKVYLEQVKMCDTHINNKLEELAHLKDMVLKVTATWKQDSTSGGTGNQDKLGNAVAKIVDLENEINKAVDEYVDKRSQIAATIDRLEDPDHVAVLYKRYFRYETWEEIACEMHCTYRNVCYIHGKALQAVEELLKGGED